jgi:hypothetical protein
LKVHPTYKTKYRVANWPSYDRALVGRGDITRRWCTVPGLSAEPPSTFWSSRRPTAHERDVKSSKLQAIGSILRPLEGLRPYVDERSRGGMRFAVSCRHGLLRRRRFSVRALLAMVWLVVPAVAVGVGA